MRVLLATTIVIIGLVIAGPVATTAAQEPLPDNCEDAPVIEDGTYGDRITPNDRHVFILELDRGDYITANLEWEHDLGDKIRIATFERDTEIYSETDTTITDVNADGERLRTGTTTSRKTGGMESIYFANVESPYNDPNYPDADGQVQVEITALGNEGQACLGIESLTDNEAYEWKLSFATNQPNVTFAPGGEADNERVKDLEHELEQKEETIEDLEQQIVELEAQLENPEGAVIIDITIEPGEGQSAFAEGGTAQITTESEEADTSELVIEYQEEAYRVGEDGIAELPIVGTGEQDLTFVYGDATETVTLDIGDSDLAEEAPPEEADDGGVLDVEEMPGFGPIVALIAIIITGMLSARQIIQT